MSWSEKIRIAILDANDDPVAFMDNMVPEQMHYYNDTLHRYIDGAAYTFECTVASNHEDIKYLEVGNKLAFRRGLEDFYCNIVKVEKDEWEVKITAYGLIFELITETLPAYKGTSMSLVQYINAWPFERPFTIRLNEVSDKRISCEWTGEETVLKRLYSLATNFDAELKFVTRLDKDWALKDVELYFYRKHSDTVQGMGQDRTTEVLKYGDEITGITKTSDITELYTALTATGKDGLTIASLDGKKEYDANGRLEFYVYGGDLRAPQARDRFPSNLKVSGDERYSRIFWTTEYTTVNDLYGNALAKLRKECQPKLTYEVDGYVEAGIGDTFTIEDTAYTPTLYVEARVVEQEICFTDPSKNKTTFDNFTEVSSQINSDLLAQVQRLIEDAKVYEATILSTGSTTFKNNEGEIKLTACVREKGLDITSRFKIQWYKNGEALTTGASINVSAETMVLSDYYMFEALDSNNKVRASYAVSVTNVLDGKSNYIHIAYAESEDGSKGFSLTDFGNKTYMGVYVNESPVPVTDYTKFQWTRIRGLDGDKGEQGEQGPQGEPGYNGESAYLHIKYSDDGGQSFTGNNGYNPGMWLGQYVDFTPADSENVKNYVWTRIKGEDGAPGINGTTGPAGPDGRTSYFHIRYSSLANPTTWDDTTDDPDLFIGTYVDFEEEDSKNPNDYKWSRFRGLQGAEGPQGPQGVPGTNGEDGHTYYLHIKYSEDGKEFSANNGEVPAAWIGQLVDTNKEDSTVFEDYAWQLVQGEKGDPGQGVTTVTPEYYRSTSNTELTGGTWSETMPDWEEGSYLYVRYKVDYVNPSSTAYTTPKVDSSWSALTTVSQAMTELESTFDTRLEEKEDSIMSQVTENVYLKEAMDTMIQQLQTSITQTSNDITIAFNQMRMETEDAVNMAEELSDFSKYIRFVDGAIELGNSESPLQVKIDNDRLSFLQAGDEVAYLSNSTMLITDAEITRSIRIGKFAFVPRPNGSLDFKKVRD